MAGFIGLALLGVILYSTCAVDWEAVSPRGALAGEAGYNAAQDGNTTRALGFSFLGLRPDTDLKAEATTPGVGYLLPSEIISVHLLVVLVGAAYLARAKRRKEPASSPGGLTGVTDG
jgi:NADH:ubiquinone oxidoreductase subunit 6 (subunit J)